MVLEYATDRTRTMAVWMRRVMRPLGLPDAGPREAERQAALPEAVAPIACWSGEIFPPDAGVKLEFDIPRYPSAPLYFLGRA
jgi:hypothetical protein